MDERPGVGVGGGITSLLFMKTCSADGVFGGFLSPVLSFGLAGVEASNCLVHVQLL